MNEIIIDENNLYVVEVIDHNVIFHYLAYDQTMRLTLNEVERLLSQSQYFVRIHKSYIINMRYIYDYDQTHVWMLDHQASHEFNIGRHYTKHFKERYAQYLASGSV